MELHVCLHVDIHVSIHVVRRRSSCSPPEVLRHPARPPAVRSSCVRVQKVCKHCSSRTDTLPPLSLSWGLWGPRGASLGSFLTGASLRLGALGLSSAVAKQSREGEALKRWSLQPHSSFMRPLWPPSVDKPHLRHVAAVLARVSGIIDPAAQGQTRVRP